MVEPQSNQRGIETWRADVHVLVLRLGLNRTSVGLKRCRYFHANTAPLRPQSNQRGIETGIDRYDEVCRIAPQSNQRGIETVGAGACSGGRSSPQSNQRGIETNTGAWREETHMSASIEPAWD